MPSRNNAHPDPLALVRHAFEVHDPALSRHLSQCPSCAEEVRRFEAAKSALRIMATAGEAGPECLGDDTLSALAEGTLEPSSRGEVMLHLTRCTHCRTAVGSLARALADPE